ncbi:hypothetical protein DBR06_SOUSAS7410077, partial [Sousa chinensis]
TGVGSFTLCALGQNSFIGLFVQPPVYPLCLEYLLRLALFSAAAKAINTHILVVGGNWGQEIIRNPENISSCLICRGSSLSALL